jgi:hypothetical protein
VEVPVSDVFLDRTRELFRLAVFEHFGAERILGPGSGSIATNSSSTFIR